MATLIVHLVGALVLKGLSHEEAVAVINRTIIVSGDNDVE